MELFTVKLTWKHTTKKWNGVDFNRVRSIINANLREYKDLPDPKIKIEIFREYE